MADPRKYIIGWLTCRPGKRDDLMKIAVPYVAESLKEEGCIFFEINPSVLNPDVVTLVECWASAEAHALHLETTTFRTCWEKRAGLCLEGKFENIFADRVETDSVAFGGTP